MNILDRFRKRQDEAKKAKPENYNRAGRRARGFRGLGHPRRKATTFMPRFIRRHYKEVMPVPFTWRTMMGRRERKVRAKMMRLNAKYGLLAGPPR